MSAYIILPQVILRTPLLSFRAFGERSVAEVLKDELFRKALYLASPGFYGVLESLQFDAAAMTAKQKLTVAKYYNRMCFRPTPFGLFSCFSLCRWDDGPLSVSEPGDVLLHLQADQQACGRLYTPDTGAAAPHRYRANPLLYRVGGEFRFIQTNLPESGTRLGFTMHQFEANHVSRSLVRHSRRIGMTGEALIGSIMQQAGCRADDAMAYLEFLKRSQILVAAQAPNIIGERPVAQLNGQLRPGLCNIRSVLNALQRPMPASETDVAGLRALEHSAKRLLGGRVAGADRSFYYANAQRNVSGGPPGHYQEKIMQAVEALRKLAMKPVLADLDRFIETFGKRFEGQRVPLLRAIDPDTGAGYGDLARQDADAQLPPEVKPAADAQAADKVSWSAVHRLLMSKWNERDKDEQGIRLAAADIDKLELTDHDPMPPSTAVLFRITAEGLFVENAGGATGLSLIGRFTPFSTEIHELAREIAGREGLANPDVVFADIGQLSDMHADNINRRLHSYDYEIPVNCGSLLPEAQQIRPDDLYVSVFKGEVILESKRLGKRIIPRLSSAYNFRHNQLALFRLLCDLQYQSVQANLAFDLQAYFPGMPHYPRVTYEDIILSPARWQPGTEQMASLCGAAYADSAAGGQAVRLKLGLPALVSITHVDQKLYFNLDRAEEAAFFFDCISRMQDAAIEEFFLPAADNAIVKTLSGQPLINQFIVFLANEGPVYGGLPPRLPNASPIQRKFIPGTQWLYLKIYCTPASANELLTGEVLPLMREIMEEKPASWFFVRYADPEHHIRLRVCVSEDRVGAVLRLFKERLSAGRAQDLIHGYQADTYVRELERYGPDLIGKAEDLFCASSELVLRFLKNRVRQREAYTEQHLAFATMPILLQAFSPDLTVQADFLELVSHSFLTEFGGAKELRVKLDGLFRSRRQEMTRFSTGEPFFKDLGLARAKRRFESAMYAAGERCRQAGEARRTAIFADLIHMHVNRVFDRRQREHELALYYCFYKFIVSRLAIRKASAGVAPALQKQVVN